MSAGRRLLLAVSVWLAPEAVGAPLGPFYTEDEHAEGHDKFSNLSHITRGDEVLAAHLIPEASPASLVSTNSSQDQDSQVLRCYNYCVQCASGVTWQIQRAQPLGRKVAKFFAFGIVAGLSFLTGPLLGWVGSLYFGALSYIGVGSTVFIGGVFIGSNMLLTGQQNRACPIVKFSEQLPENAGLLHGIAAEFKDGWRRMFSGKGKEQRYSLSDVNYYELLLRSPGVKEDDLQDSSATLIQGERAKIPDKERLRMAMACNFMTLNKKYWVQEREKTHPIKQGQENSMEEALVRECGEWLCNGVNHAVRAKHQGWYQSCRTVFPKDLPPAQKSPAQNKPAQKKPAQKKPAQKKPAQKKPAQKKR